VLLSATFFLLSECQTRLIFRINWYCFDIFSSLNFTIERSTV
jgi:hypothetical protein